MELSKSTDIVVGMMAAGGTRSRWWRAIAATGLLAMAFTGAAAGQEAAPPRRAGWIEQVRIGPAKVAFEAKLDTGAETSSIGVPLLTRIERDGVAWVMARLMTADWQILQIEAPVVRMARIVRAGAPVEERPVIELAVCLGGIEQTVEFTLADRSELSQQVLLGRNFLADRFVVDAGRRGLIQGGC
jgi:hypothetical protein